VPEIVDPPRRRNSGGLLRWPPLERSEVMNVEVAPSLAGEQQRRAVAVLNPVERVERACWQRHRSRAQLRLRDLELSSRERAANKNDAFLAVDIAFLEGDPFRRPQPGRRGEQGCTIA
jgi:hypothetical protein